MGYMGFGMRKEDYQRKPKASYHKVKKVYGDHLENYKALKGASGKWTEKEKKEFKNFVKQKLKKRTLLEGTYNALVFILLLVIVLFAIGAAFMR